MNQQFRVVARVAAVLLLMLTGAELFACEMIAPDRCASFGFPSDDSNSTSEDNCMCCSTHIVVAEPISLDACVEAVGFVSPAAPAPPESDPLSIYHPP